RMPAPVLERALELLPDVDFVNAYGLTETSSTVAVLGPDDHRAAVTSGDPVVRRRLESCGRAVPGVEFRIVEGEVWIRGDQVDGGRVALEVSRSGGRGRRIGPSRTARTHGPGVAFPRVCSPVR